MNVQLHFLGLFAILFIPPVIPAGIRGILEFQWNSGSIAGIPVNPVLLGGL